MSDDCTLSPHARAFSAVLTAFVGSIVNGLSSGYIVAFMTGWISWFATLRILGGALYEYYILVSPKSGYTNISQNNNNEFSTQNAANDAEAQQQQQQQPPPFENLELTNMRALPFQTTRAERRELLAQRLQAGGRRGNSATERLASRLKTDVTFLGWFGWLYTVVYTPITQILWTAASFGPASGSLKLARAVGISVSAFALTVDTKARYGAALARGWGPWAGVAFNVWNATVALGLGGLCVALLVAAVVDLGLQWYLVVIYCVFCVIWAAASFKVLPVRDGGVKGGGIILDVFVGAFAGIVLAVPAFVIWQDAKFAADTAEFFGDDG